MASIVSSCLGKCSHRQSAKSTVQFTHTFEQHLGSRLSVKCRDLLDISFLDENASDSRNCKNCICTRCMLGNTAVYLGFPAFPIGRENADSTGFSFTAVQLLVFSV